MTMKLKIYLSYNDEYYYFINIIQRKKMNLKLNYY